MLLILIDHYLNHWVALPLSERLATPDHHPRSVEEPLECHPPVLPYGSIAEE